MKTITVYYSDDFKKHDPTPYHHPENPNRLVLALNIIQHLENIHIVEPPIGDTKVYLNVHSNDYYDMIIESITNSDSVVWVDPDTYVSSGTLKALQRLAGAVESSLDMLQDGEGPFLILGRPPGHHAGYSGTGLGAPTLGFCIFNTSALLAILLSRLGKTLVFDFDAHHGNGTQDILWEKDILHIDIHQDASTIYPGTGYPRDIGGKPGTKININVPPHAGDDLLEHAISIVDQIIADYEPEYIVVSAGFDGYINDNQFVSLRYSEHTFYLLGKTLSKYSDKIITVLEGGYGLGLSNGLQWYLLGLQGYPHGPKPVTSSDPSAWNRYKSRLKELKELIELDQGL